VNRMVQAKASVTCANGKDLAFSTQQPKEDMKEGHNRDPGRDLDRPHPPGPGLAVCCLIPVESALTE
jgi:hypothetical protein